MEDYLSVHEYVYDGVVERAALSKVNWYSSDDGVYIKSGVYDDSKGHGSIGQPGDKEG